MFNVWLVSSNFFPVGTFGPKHPSPLSPFPPPVINSYVSGGVMPTSAALHATQTRAWSIADRLPALAVLMFGLVVLYAVGFSSFARAHNAAHDARHANGFPCH